MGIGVVYSVIILVVTSSWCVTPTGIDVVVVNLAVVAVVVDDVVVDDVSVY